MAKKRSNTKTYHYHGCDKCHTKFGDNCATPNASGTCRHCMVGAARWVILWEATLPKDCCIETSILLPASSKADKTHLGRYDLSLGCPWYQCQLCKRCHPYDDPTKIRREGWGGETRI